MPHPTEHFSRVPVFRFEPGLSSPARRKRESFPRSLMSRLLVRPTRRALGGSAPSSLGPRGARRRRRFRAASGAAPAWRRLAPTAAIAGASLQPHLGDFIIKISLSYHGNGTIWRLFPFMATEKSFRLGSRLSRSKTVGRPETKKEKLKGLQMTVCHDCKTMVLQIIKSSRTSRSNAIRNLTLNLSPVY
ncbi:Uncharacterized protein GBIM_02835 [Gryllus bimaculatus]|nr:Uncharacterized protein GBIM_02835 [Gryllus bimaculatus]